MTQPHDGAILLVYSKMDNLEDKFYLAINKVLEKTNMSLLKVNINKKRSGYDIKLIIDSKNGISLNDCAHVSQLTKDTINLEQLISDDFNLEVSSPGVNRPLFTIKDYSDFVGETIKVKLKIPVNEKRNIKGKIISVKENIVILEENNNQMKIYFENINKGNLIKDI